MTSARRSDGPGRCRVPVVFGAADGLTVVLGIIVSLIAADPSAVVRAAVGAGVTELVGNDRRAVAG